jgi:hypothetical protein
MLTYIENIIYDIFSSQQKNERKIHTYDFILNYLIFFLSLVSQGCNFPCSRVSLSYVQVFVRYERTTSVVYFNILYERFICFTCFKLDITISS